MSLFLIAEIGINHNGDLNIAKQLIKAASDANFDAVKFQKRTIDIVYTQEFLESHRESPWGNTQRAQKEGLEFSREQFEEIDSFCDELGIQWSASAWDLEAQDFIDSFDCSFNKLASPMLGNIPLVKKIAQSGKKTFVSTGMSTLEEIDEIVSIFNKANCEIELMHCNSTYPMKEENANLLCIPMLRDRYKLNVGYSGHESSLIKVCASAVALGATSLERHITLDRTMYGSDQAASIEAASLNNFVDVMRKIPQILGTGEKVISEEESIVRKKLRVEING